MTIPSRDYEEDLAFLRAKLAQPKAEREKWLNEIVDAWIARLKASRTRRRTVR